MTAHAQTVLICGATGTAGRAAAMALRDDGQSVIAYGRTAPDIEGIEAVTGSMQDTSALSAVFASHKIDSVVSCLASRSGTPSDAWAVDHGANLDLLAAAKHAGVGHFVLISAICVQKPRLAFQHAKLAFEDTLIRSGLPYSIVRPTAFFKSLSGQLDRLRAGKPYLMFGDGTLTACKPISDADLGRFIASCLTDSARQNAILPIGGPGPALTPRDMGKALFDALGISPRFRSVSPRVISAIAGTLSLGGRFSERIATKAELARIGHYYATESMLLWNAETCRYEAEATPEFGSDTLTEFYHALANGEVTISRGAHAVF
ncbi:NAD(P)H-binding protein [Sulfitobacter sp. JBTF-M27]|uniref:Divinyl chlorophyllide a 8-vinyl-reductase, chloroplastic n=1 Tax=Sulfitobacter sediminilitoris TaxID=2698830 RepID=A0A6P0CE65_9RHOB|nr:NAD(P)H-binding protein [Sulfitobacter sediminilitoris]NEK24481.1 NAD(P)H-binding protein [Sulfitobacter sediminilitoris]